MTLGEHDLILKDSADVVYNLIPVLIAISRFDNDRLISVNQAWIDLLEYSYEEVIGKTTKDLNIFVDYNQRRRMAREIAKHGVVRNKEMRIRTKTGRIITGMFSGDLLSHGNEKLLITTMLDITQNKMQQEKIIKAEVKEKENQALKEAVMMKDEFIMLISHEFKTPLAVINAATHALEKVCNKEISGKAKKYISNIRNSSNRQLKLVNNLLDISRAKADHMKIHKTNTDIVSLTRIIVESVKIYADNKDINLLFSSRLKRKIIGIDTEKYERILMNLISNAIKFTPKGKSVYVNVNCEDKKVCIQVIDEGVGIPNDKKEIIFKKFEQSESLFSRQSEGSGLGLYLSKILVEKMDGQISLQSKEGEGSIFKVVFNDEKVKHCTGSIYEEVKNDRLIMNAAIEFSDV